MKNIYKDTAAEWNLSRTEIRKFAIFLYRGAFTKEELTEYLSEENMNTPLKRYEAAKSLPKQWQRILK